MLLCLSGSGARGPGNDSAIVSREQQQPANTYSHVFWHMYSYQDMTEQAERSANTTPEKGQYLTF